MAALVGHATEVGTNRWDAKCSTESDDPDHVANLAIRTNHASAIAAMAVHLDEFPEHQVKVFEE